MKSAKLALLALLATALTAGGLPAQSNGDLAPAPSVIPAPVATPSQGALVPGGVELPADPAPEDSSVPAEIPPVTAPDAAPTEAAEPEPAATEPAEHDEEHTEAAEEDDLGFDPVVGGGFPVPGPNTPMVTEADGTVRSAVETDISAMHDHDHGQAQSFSTRDGGASTMGAAARSGTIQVTLVFATLKDDRRGVNQTAAKNSITAANSYWRAMSNNRLGMNIASTRTLASTASSWQDYAAMMNTIKKDLGWRDSAYKALVVYVPANDLNSGGYGGILGGGWTTGGTGGSVLMPAPSSFSNNVVTHEFGHVLGLLHANSLKCNNGRADVGVNAQGRWSDGSCTSREYGDTSDLMGYAQYNSPAINSYFWDAGGFGRGNEVVNAGTPDRTKSYTLRPWAGSAANRAVKFRDTSGETYYLELRLPVGRDTATAVGGNRGVKIVKADLANNWAVNSLVVGPNTRDFVGYTNANSTWQAGQTFTTHAGTKVRVDWINGDGAGITISPKYPLDWSKKVFSPGDFNGDRKADLLTRRTDGTLWFSAGRGNGTFATPVRIGSGWEIFNEFIPVGDTDGDGKNDIFARHVDGSLWRYSGTGAVGSGNEGYRAGVKIGNGGWDAFNAFAATGDADGDGRNDFLARTPNGTVSLYSGTGNGQHGKSRVVATGWQNYNAMVGARDFNGDGRVDVVTRTSEGNLQIMRGTGRGEFIAGPIIGSYWNMYATLLGGADFNSDGKPDLYGYQSNGKLVFYAGTGRISEGYQAAAPTRGLAPGAGAKLINAGDFNGDGVDDLLSMNTSGKLLLHPGNGTTSGAYRTATGIGVGWNIYSDVIAADFNRDGKPDLVGRAADGTLWFYAGTGKVNAKDEGYKPRERIGSGWNIFTEVIAAGDLNSDGIPDILARHSNGTLWLYTGTGTMGNGREGYRAGQQIGNGGWNAFASLTAAGDYDRNGTSDILARYPDGSLFLYRGAGNGTLRSGEPVGSGWNIFTSLTGPGNTSVASRYGFTALMRDGSSRFYKSTGMADEGYRAGTAAGTL